MALIMAMSMEQAFVIEVFPSAETLGGEMINFNDIGVLKQ